MQKNRGRSHLHALRAAAAVTGRARALGPSLLVGLIGAQACSQGPAQGEPGWELESPGAPMEENVREEVREPDVVAADMQATERDAGVRAARPDMPPGASSEDMATALDDMSTAEPDQMVVSCLDDAGATSWTCCVEVGRDAQGCAFCSDPYVDQAREPDCLSCWSLSISGDAQGYSACCQMFADQEDLYRAGCSPWGPPAPPRYVGARIAELLAA